MPGGGKICNGVMHPGELSTDGYITYTRKKRERAICDEHSVKESIVGASEPDVFPIVINHWRNTLEYILNLSGVGEGGGIQSCINGALETCPSRLFSKKIKEDVPISIAQSEDRFKGNCEIEEPPEIRLVQTNTNKNISNCQKVLLDILSSEIFASFCDLVCENFQNKTARKLFDFSMINSKFKNGSYEQFPVSFLEDIQELWSKFQKIGQDIQLLSSSLSKQSRIYYGNQVGEKPEFKADEENIEENNPQEVADLKNSMNSHVLGQFPLCESGRSNGLDQSEASCLCKVYPCKKCGFETDNKHRLVCDGCEAIFHFSCTDPLNPAAPSRIWYCSSCQIDKKKLPASVRNNRLKNLYKSRAIMKKNIANNFKECDFTNKPSQSETSCRHKVYTCKRCSTEVICERSLICDGCEAIHHFSCVEPFGEEFPPRNWYCASCSADRTDALQPAVEGQQNVVHQNCVICDRFDFSEVEKDIANHISVSSDSSMESDSHPEPSSTAIAHLCKFCGTCEDEDKRFLTCGSRYCPYKYYHIRCLRNSQIASRQQQNRQCWYCPSCLCRVCYLDQDDTEIVLCDGCDEGYHTYCMKPPRTSVPKGQWYCTQCNMARAKEAMRRHEQWILQQHCKKDDFQAIEIEP